MNNEERIRRSGRLTILMPVGLLLVYVLSYFVLMTPVGFPIVTGIGPWNIPRTAGYEILGEKGEYFYAPIHFVDRKLRPDYWVIHIDP